MSATSSPAATAQSLATDSFFSKLGEFDHEQVVICNDNTLGLKAIIAVHSSVLGPALGGCRFYDYVSDQDALTDVLRLSRGMTYKAAISGLNLGGGKSVIIGDPKQLKNEALLRRFGKFVENLGGKYITAEDVNINVQDMEFVAEETNHVTGLPASMGGGGDPSPVTAYGVKMGIQAALKYQTGSDSVAGKKIIIQGVGKVGFHLAEHLASEGAELYLFDLWEEGLKRAVEATGGQVITEQEVFTMQADVYAPCAMGATLNPDTIPSLNVGIVAGAANNQLLEEVRDGQALRERGILYAPDFLINAGGLINVSGELEGYNRNRAFERTERIFDRALEVFSTAHEQNQTPHEAALDIAEKRIQALGRMQQFI